MSAGEAVEAARAGLLASRPETARRLAGLERDFAGLVESASQANTDDEHDPEGATLAFERQHLAALIDQARQKLTGIDTALARIDAGWASAAMRDFSATTTAEFA